jgi:hypothetical protein
MNSMFSLSSGNGVLIILVEESIYNINVVYILSGFRKALRRKVRSLKQQKHVNVLSQNEKNA